MKRSPINKIGKIGRANLEANRRLKKLWEEKDIRFCEIRLPGCTMDWLLQNVHRHKRVFYNRDVEKLSDFRQVVRGCQNCHDKI